VFRRFRRWAVAGVFERMFKALREDPDFEYVIADGTIVRVHQKATGAAKRMARPSASVVGDLI
jgi:transposase